MTANELMNWAKINGACEEGIAFAKGKTLAEVWATSERPDWMVWLYERSKNLEKAVCIKIAIFVAELNLPDFEKWYPEDDRPRKALEAAKAWIESPTEENRLACETAAKNAAYAAYASASASAFAFAAYTISYATHAAYAVRFLEIEQQKEVVNYIRKLIPSIELK